ncbi:MAG: hypothetical protein WCB53_03025 [Terriglobales bacterium]
MNRNDAERERGDANESDVDRWLDDALAVYAKAEPRAGLEGRVLAQLQAEREDAERSRVALRRGWWLALRVVTATGLAVIAVWVWQSGRDARQHVTAKKSATSQKETVRETVQGVSDSPSAVSPVTVQRGSGRLAETHPPVLATKHRAIRPRSNQALAAAPKLDQFPSPRPLSEQEQILMSYVARYPESAALVAQARTEELEQDRKKEELEAAQGSSE